MTGTGTFGSAALKTFAHVLAGITSHRVRVEVRGDRSYTDGTLVVLPDRGVWEADDFRALCGDAAHEVAHVAFGTNQAMKEALADYPDAEARLARLCFNAVVDVADETRFQKAFPKAEELFARGSEAALENACAAGAIPPRPPAAPTAWQVLVAGIWLVRSRPGSPERRTLRGWRSRVPGLRDAVRILARAKDRSRATGTLSPRTPAGWRHLRELARELVELLKPLGLPQDAAPDDPLGRWRQAARDALLTQGADAAAGGTAANHDDWAGAVAGPANADPGEGGDDDGGPAPDDPPPASATGIPENLIGYDEECYRRVLPVFRQTARALPIGQTVSFEEGHQTGGRLSRPHRAMIDGKCFRRLQQDEGTEGAIALVFDHSDSMAGALAVFLPVGVALADALAGVGLEVAVWRYGAEVERMERIHDLEQPRLMGSTRTDLALAEARSWLQGRSAWRKIAVLFTDGEPDESGAMMDEAIRLRRADVELILGSLGLGRERCARLVPWATVFDVDPSAAASSLQLAIKRIGRQR
jgi:hypothetical protein